MVTFSRRKLMQFDIRSHGFDLTESLREHAERRLGFALDWARYDVKKVSVCLSDINGPRGGNDKRCQVRISLPRVREVVIEDTDADLYVAIDRAIDRTERTVARRLDRLREFPHIHINAVVSCEANAERDAVMALSTD
jgi:ribosomal subunit interface protein